MDIIWGAIGLLAVVGSTTAALAVRRADPARPWFAAGSDGAWSRRPEDPERLLLADRDAARAAVELAAARDREGVTVARATAGEVARTRAVQADATARAGAAAAGAGAPVPDADGGGGAWAPRAA